jgi:hypothetical protein
MGRDVRHRPRVPFSLLLGRGWRLLTTAAIGLKGRK